MSPVLAVRAANIMLILCHKAPSPAALAAPVISEASPKETFWQVDVCRPLVVQSAWCLPKKRGLNHLLCRRCVLVEELCHHVKELFEKVSRLSSICENKKEIGYSQRPYRLFAWDISKEMCLLEVNRSLILV